MVGKLNRSMKTLLMAVLATLAFGLAQTAFAQTAPERTPDFEGLVTLSNSQKIFAIEYKARAGAPTVVLVNGLTYSTVPWQKTAKTLAQTDLGILLFDPRGMGKTLEATGPATEIIPLAQQVEDLYLLLQERGIQKATFAGLSYGGALSLAFAETHPERVEKLVLMAPFIRALKGQDDYIKGQIAKHRAANPDEKRSDEELYDFFLKDLVYKTYPVFEPVVKEHPWRIEAVYQMVRGVRHFKGIDTVKSLGAIPIHLVIAGKDQYVDPKEMAEFWSALRPDQQASLITVRGSEHKLPEAVPNFLAGWITQAAQANPFLTGGRVFDGDPTQGTAIAQDAKVEGLPKD